MITVYLLSALAGAALGLLVWAIATLAPAGPPRAVRIPRHARWTGEGGTTKLTPPPPRDWAQLPPLPDDPTQNLIRPPD
jgi:hypothetical protein